MRKLCLLVVVVLTLVALVGCGTASTIQKVDKGASPAPAASKGSDNVKPAKESAAPKPPETYKVGDTVKFDNLQITLNGVRTSKGSDFQKPKNGAYLLVDLTIENKGTEAATISTMLSMLLYDSESFKHDITIFTKAKGSVDGEIPPGRKIRGEVTFDVPASGNYEFAYEDPFTTGQAIWKFTSK